MSLVIPCGPGPTTILRIWTLIREDLRVCFHSYKSSGQGEQPASYDRGSLTTSQQNRETSQRPTHTVAASRPVCSHTQVDHYVLGLTSCGPKAIFGTRRLRAYIRYHCLDSRVSPSHLISCSSTTQLIHLALTIANATVTAPLGSLACLLLLLCLSSLLVLCGCLTAQNGHSTTQMKHSTITCKVVK